MKRIALPGREPEEEYEIAVVFESRLATGEGLLTVRQAQQLRLTLELLERERQVKL